jgi:hypothetical protein
VGREEPEAFLREMLAPLRTARPGESLRRVPFSHEAVANAFVMLGLLPEARAEEILAWYRAELEAKGFRFGVLTGELSVRPGAHGYQDARMTRRGDLTEIPLAAAGGPVPLPVSGRRAELNLNWATLTPGGAKLRLAGTTPGEVSPTRPGQLPYRMVFSPDPALGLANKAVSGLSVTDDLGRAYRLRVGGWRTGPRGGGQPGRTFEGDVLARPEADTDPAEPAVGPSGRGAVASWLEFAAGSEPPVRVPLRAGDDAPAGPAEPPWPTPAECYLATLASVTSMSIGTDDRTVQLDTAGIVAAVADALLWVGALPPDSALLTGTTPASPAAGWRQELKYLWGGQAYQRARASEPERAGLAVPLPLRRATVVIESIAAQGGYVSIQLYGHPWVSGEYWPMITPCFQVRAVDDAGAEHEGVRGSGGGAPEGSFEFSFWPPVALEAKRIRVIVSTLWEAAWAEVAIPGRS